MRARPLKILIVENHEDTLTFLSQYLEECGREVRSARRMDSALEMLAGGKFDILLCDIGLPDGDGWQLMRRLGELETAPPFSIAMSGYSTRTEIEKSRSAGFRHHLIKPFLPEELDALLSEASEMLDKN